MVFGVIGKGGKGVCRLLGGDVCKGISVHLHGHKVGWRKANIEFGYGVGGAGVSLDGEGGIDSIRCSLPVGFGEE